MKSISLIISLILMVDATSRVLANPPQSRYDAGPRSVFQDSNMVARLYDCTYKEFYKYLSGRPTKQEIHYKRSDFNYEPEFIIFNHDGYAENQEPLESYGEQGRPITFEEDQGKQYPIGYTIYFPKNMDRPLAIKVNIYGGDTKKDKDQWLSFSNLDKVDQYLLNHDVLLINLLLPDLLGRRSQYQTSKKFIMNLQAGIHKFWQEFHDAPDTFHQALHVLKDEKLPMYLYGASFGGKMALLQAEAYPQTWTGYIFLASSLSNRATSDLQGRISSSLDILLAERDIDQLGDPLLILGNAHDNNVPMRTWTDFYKRVKNYDKKHRSDKQGLIYSWFTYKNSKLENEMINTGHFAPSSGDALIKYVQVMWNFMVNRDDMYKGITKKPDSLTSQQISHLINKKGLVKSYENDISATAEELFLAEVYARARTNNSEELAKENQNDIFIALYLIKDENKIEALENLVKQADDIHLAKGLHRDYQDWIRFAKDFVKIKEQAGDFNCESFLEDDESGSHFEGFENFDSIGCCPFTSDEIATIPDSLDTFPKELLNSYKNALLQVINNYKVFQSINNYNDENIKNDWQDLEPGVDESHRAILAFIRAMRSFLLSNLDLLKKLDPSLRQEAEQSFEKAYARWDKWQKSYHTHRGPGIP